MRRPPRSLSRSRRGGLDPDQAADAGAIRRSALVLLSRRDFASPELVEKLTGQGYAGDPVREVVADLAAERLLDDVRYAANYVAWHASRGQGPMRIRQDLLAAGLPAAMVAEALDSGPDFAAICRQTRERRFGAELPAEWKERARQARFLQYRGFSSDHIRSAFGPDFDPEE
jgi:regulatory protein